MDNLKIIAEAYEAEVEAVEFLPYLLQDLWALGSYPDQIIKVISELSLGKEKAKFLDLGCGNGALSISIAEKFNCNVKGIDAFSAFIEKAKVKASEKNVSNLTSFICGDVKELIENEKDYDVVILSSVGPIWDDYSTAVKKIRKSLKPFGYLILEEGFIADNIINENYLSHKEIVEQIISSGDEIVKEIIFPREWLVELNKQNNKFIQQRAAELYNKYPDKVDIIKQYVDGQVSECEFLEKNFQSALWVLKKGK
jgi:2-polyprenyl-3-methyl-5-hydroxy-6-metoxy-1,4-benzoquinol methylase